MKLQISKTSLGHKVTKEKARVGSSRVGGFSHGSRWQQLTAAAHGSRSQLQMAADGGTDRGSRWQQIAAADHLLGVDFGRVRLQAFGFGSTHSRLVLFYVLFVCFTVCDCVCV